MFLFVPGDQALGDGPRSAPIAALAVESGALRVPRAKTDVSQLRHTTDYSTYFRRLSQVFRLPHQMLSLSIYNLTFLLS